MGSADIILDLVSTGTTMRENNLREIEGGQMLDSEGILVARRSALLQRAGTLGVVREMLERLEAHMKAQELFTVGKLFPSDAPCAQHLKMVSTLFWPYLFILASLVENGTP
ncbi:ATP phosphoribosyltransferase [Cymbomonas tetramitiformis]|uniref:ATP phosphoribosyltransferase n=1 Tax=Cymbomonas tetramitiformis TaxID=36881 RepID=A0AAE0BGJ8_9CHLO|nr:ATP phosphoribosyltransferase [Cymbomonas tetramitiformis]